MSLASSFTQGNIQQTGCLLRHTAHSTNKGNFRTLHKAYKPLSETQLFLCVYSNIYERLKDKNKIKRKK